MRLANRTHTVLDIPLSDAEFYALVAITIIGALALILAGSTVVRVLVAIVGAR